MKRIQPQLLGALALLAFPRIEGCRSCEGERPDLRADRADATASPASIVIAFAKQSPIAGTRFQETASSRTKLELAVDPGTGKAQSIALETSVAERRVVEVLAASAGAATRLRVTFLDKTEALREGTGKDKTKRSALAGKSYVVAAADGHVEVSDDKGKPAPQVEAKEVAAEYATLGKPDALLAAMPASIAAGQAVPALAKALEQEMASRSDGATLSDARVVFRGLAGEEGLFDVRFTVTRDEGPLRLVMPLAGTLTVARATSWPLGLEVAGAVTATASKDEDQGRAKLAGKGQMSLSFKVE